MWPRRDRHAGPRAPSGRSRAMPGPARTHSQPPGGSNNPQVRLPGGARCCTGPIAAAGRVTRARISPCRVLHTIDWEGLQSLCELTLVDALHCSLMCANYAHQRQREIGEPCSGDHQLAGDVRWSWSSTQHDHSGVLPERLLHHARARHALVTRAALARGARAERFARGTRARRPRGPINVHARGTRARRPRGMMRARLPRGAARGAHA